jgi:hypothetical protein
MGESGRGESMKELTEKPEEEEENKTITDAMEPKTKEKKEKGPDPRQMELFT